jgi:hypothetical protein
VIDGDLNRPVVPGAHHAVLRRRVLVLNRRDDDRRTDPQSVPRQIQRSIAFDERKQVTPAKARVVVLDREIENRLAALLCRLPGARASPLGQSLRLGGGLPLEPAE